ncbi:sarcosine oxidase subunit beta [Collimonas sp. PA-H2]|uniref:NAD(P)/FAD-dependent oxidoreductase n=1 Tax=Collimonas sp. PA-H2 TaxID=1881062 RepID=UPI000BF2C9AF|nr:FAD-dependent oxidoreductase [Collimonas sp. PA-H2]PFH07813.1 sarcosine oxidase subunit beta [Collimonas sp. PA-H2]
MNERLTADVAIIGGGLMGCSAALALRRMNLSVVLLEQGWCGAQASGVNYGGVRRQGRPVVQLPLSQRAYAIWQHLPQLIGSDCEYTVSGHLKLARNEAELASLEDYRGQADGFGLQLEILGRAALRQRYPWLGEKVAGGSLCPGDGHANPRLVAAAFAMAARKHGADLREGTTVESAVFEGGKFAVCATDGLEVKAKFLLNCAGAWGAKFAEQFGEQVPEYPIFPNMWVTEPMPKLVEPNVGIVGGGFYVRQVARGNFVLGGGRGMGQLAIASTRPDSAAMFASMRMACEFIPALRNALVIRNWTGVEGALPDHQPVLGPSVTTPGLFHAFGFSGAGFQLAPAVGEVLADLVVHGATATPIEAFSIARFSATS